MTLEASQNSPGSELPEDRFIARIFTLADYAEANHLNGKLYITGGGVANIWTAPIPGPLAPLHLAFRIRVPGSTHRNRSQWRFVS